MCKKVYLWNVQQIVMPVITANYDDVF